MISSPKSRPFSLPTEMNISEMMRDTLACFTYTWRAQKHRHEDTLDPNNLEDQNNIPQPQQCRHFSNDITNLSPILLASNKLYQFNDNKLCAWPPHAPGDWSLYHTPEALYPARPEAVPGPSTSHLHPPALNHNERSILSYMNIPSFCQPQLGSSSYYCAFR